MSSINKAVAFAALITMGGCKHMEKPHITAVSLQPGTFGCESGIPFYLPKPLLIISKNFRNIEEAKVGLTDSAPIPTTYDDQAKYADLNARTNFAGLGGSGTQSGAIGATGSTDAKSGPHATTNGSAVTPGVVPSDGLAPDTFYTYQIVFVPDLSQKYGLKIRGGAGEIRAAMNLVNGWQFTGLGPYYMKDSSTAQNLLAGGIATRLGGQAVADVLNEVNDLAGTLGQSQSGTITADDAQLQSLARTISALPQECAAVPLIDFAEIHVYEAGLGPDGVMHWQPIAQHTFNRDYLGMQKTDTATVNALRGNASSALAGAAGTTQSGLIGDNPIYKAHLARALGVPAESISPGQTQSGALDGTQSGAVATPPGGINQVQVDCGGAACPPTPKEFNLFKFGHHKKKESRGRIRTKIVRAASESFLGSPTNVSGGGDLGSAGGASPSAADVPAEPAAERLPVGVPAESSPEDPGTLPLPSPSEPNPGTDPLFDDGAAMERLPRPVANADQQKPQRLLPIS